MARSSPGFSKLSTFFCMASAKGTAAKSRPLWTLVCSVALFCTVAGIIAPAQRLTTLANFNGSNGIDPQNLGALVLASDGNLYGTTYDGGAHNAGTIFK